MNDAWNDSYIYAIVALLPLSALMLVSQVNPYHALVIRGALGAVAAMVYGILGAADVALTEALMGTMLAITLMRSQCDRPSFSDWGYLMMGNHKGILEN